MPSRKIIDALANSEASPRSEDAATSARAREEASTTTRVNKRVIRRRRRGPEAAPPAAAAAAPAAAPAPAKRVAAKKDDPAPVGTAEAPTKVVAAPAPAPAPAPEPAAAPPVVAQSAPVEPAPKAEEAPAPAVEAKPAPVVTPEPASTPEPAAAVVTEPAAPAAAAPAAPAAPASAPEPVAAAPAAEPPAAAAPDTAPPADGATSESAKLQKRFPKLGSAVVALPPGYDPTRVSPTRSGTVGGSATPRWGADKAAGATATGTGTDAARRRRRVASDVSTGPATGGQRGRGRRGRPSPMMRPGRGRRRKSSGPKAASPQPKAQKRKVRVDNVISVGQLAKELSIKAALVMKKLMEMDMLVTINDMLDIDTATYIAEEFEYEVENVGFQEANYLQHVGEEVEEVEGDPRPPVVTIMGHVDHGKTTLLDTIRESRVAAGEAGGITQHIGAYQVEVSGQVITFLDTPGHAAFSSMRARGAKITDMVILVVAADDGVQPQTVEAISHAKAAGVPIIVAVNKIDKPGVNPDTVKQRLGEHELIPEEWGGDTLFCNVSALKSMGIDGLLETVLLQAEVLDLRAPTDRHAEGTVIEAKMQRGRGPVASVLVQQGTLKRGDHIVIGETFGRVRAMADFKGKNLKEAGPSTPVEVFGLSGLPRTGDIVSVVENERNARKLAEHRAVAAKEAELAKTRRRTREDIMRMNTEEDRKELALVLKADVQGSLEAFRAAVEGLEIEDTEVRVLHAGVGNINESDVSLVAANGGHLIGFNVKVDARARRAADDAGVKPDLYTVIYAALDRVEGLLKGMLEPIFEEQHQGSAEVRATFNISRLGTIAGCYVLEGKIGRNHGARVYRDNKVIWEGEVNTLKRFKDDVREVANGYECGIGLNGFNDVVVGDVIQTFAMIEIERT